MDLHQGAPADAPLDGTKFDTSHRSVGGPNGRSALWSFYLNSAVIAGRLKIPSLEGWRAATAVAERRGGCSVMNTHPEAFGFLPSQEGI